MPFYKSLKNQSKKDRLRIIAGIQRIRAQLSQNSFPEKKSSETLILGTWNIRNFDDNRFNYGPRTKESMYYIAEIISKFDIIAVQEICEQLEPVEQLMNHLGSGYDYIVTDVTHSSLGGNRERLGFIYDKHKVEFKGIVGEIVLPQKMLISEADKKGRQFARTPFGVMFQSGWFKFQFSTVHIYYGSNSGNTPQYERRVKEIEAVAKYLSKEARLSDVNQILVGDFNIKARGSKGFNALEKNGFKTVNNRLGSNRDQTKFYDQISFRPRENELVFVEPERDDRVIQFFDSVYRSADFSTYRDIIVRLLNAKLKKAENGLAESTTKSGRKKYNNQLKSINSALASEASLREYYEEWRTFQMSDHLPLWVELEVDFSDQYLDFLKS
ncbi:Endonuclease/exonuclease/phosphatase [hydrothermal vent metagenome]|uniref:Endonuclease/exonuclease/phosphatase n=1 Tax=hydrothermal vent metagenome TaxID=652676 RepID=A0A3B0WY81_9ZZZZ